MALYSWVVEFWPSCAMSAATILRAHRPFLHAGEVGWITKYQAFLFFPLLVVEATMVLTGYLTAPLALRRRRTTPPFQAGERDIVIILKGPSNITTSAPDNVIVHTRHDLFSHPYTYRLHGKGDPHGRHQVSRTNLFSEQADPYRPFPEGQAKQPPRDPFERTSLDTMD